MKRLAILLILVAAAACGDDPLDPSQLAGGRFDLAAVGGEDLPAFVYDFLGDDVYADHGDISFSTTGFTRSLVTCIDTGAAESPCGTVTTVGSWTRDGDNVTLTPTLSGPDLEMAVDGPTLRYEYRDRLYEWERR